MIIVAPHVSNCRSGGGSVYRGRWLLIIMTFKDTRQIIKMSTTEGQRLLPKTALYKSTELIPHNVQNMPFLAILI